MYKTWHKLTRLLEKGPHFLPSATAKTELLVLIFICIARDKYKKSCADQNRELHGAVSSSSLWGPNELDWRFDSIQDSTLQHLWTHIEPVKFDFTGTLTGLEELVASKYKRWTWVVLHKEVSSYKLAYLMGASTSESFSNSPGDSRYGGVLCQTRCVSFVSMSRMSMNGRLPSLEAPLPA